jgi:cytochrome c oxidase subunit I
VLMGTMQLNMLIHNTLFVVGHFHATVVSGTTLAFMGISYYLLPLLSQRKLVAPKMAQWQPYVFAAGVALLTLAMLQAGRLGVPRRVADLDYTDAPLGVTVFQSGPTPAVMLLVSVGALIAVTGGIMFVWVMVATLLKGERTDRPDQGLGFAIGTPARERQEELRRMATATKTKEKPDTKADARGLRGRWQRFEAPGTYLLVLIFLAWFVIMYIIAHFNLAQAWPVG